jgi:hypothetical protein
VAADTCHVLNIISDVHVAVSAQEMQGLTVGWGYNIMFHQLMRNMVTVVFKYSDLCNSLNECNYSYGKSFIGMCVKAVHAILLVPELLILGDS